jgi:hypothetical protein
MERHQDLVGCGLDQRRSDDEPAVEHPLGVAVASRNRVDVPGELMMAERCDAVFRVLQRSAMFMNATQSCPAESTGHERV